MSFKMTSDPQAVWVPAIEAWRDNLLGALDALMTQEAASIQQFMRDNAPWKDDKMPGREYLKAEPILSTMNMTASQLGGDGGKFTWGSDLPPSPPAPSAPATSKKIKEQVVGVLAYYDLNLYRSVVSEPWEDWATAHEMWTFSNAGVISIIVPRRSPTVLGEKAEELMMRVRVLIGSTPSANSSVRIPPRGG